MKAFKFFFFLLCFQQTLLSQKNVLYKGPFMDGTAEYQYYEDENYNRIYQGPFKYVTEHIKITGQYQKNQRVGMWTIIKTVLPPEDNFKETIVGNYKSDDLDGEWKLERIELKTKKIIFSTTAIFHEGQITNTFKYQNEDFDHEINSFKVQGQFSNKGKLDSTWIIRYNKDGIPYEDIRKFKEGMIIFQLFRNLSTGEIIEKYENSGLPKVFYIDEGKTTMDYVEYLKTTPDRIYSQFFEIWKRIKTPNSYLFEDPYIYVRSSDEKLIDIF